MIKWPAIFIMFVFHNPSMCLPDYSSPVRMLTCRNQKQPCSWFEKPCWEKEISWCPFQIPINPLCTPQSPINTSSPPSTLPFLYCMYFFFSFLACFASMWGAQQSICLGGLQMVSAVRQNEDVPLSLCCALIAFSTACKLMDMHACTWHEGRMTQ